MKRVAKFVGSAMVLGVLSTAACVAPPAEESASNDQAAINAIAAPAGATQVKGLYCLSAVGGVALAGWGALQLGASGVGGAAIATFAPATGGLSLAAAPADFALGANGLLAMGAGAAVYTSAVVGAGGMTGLARDCAAGIDALADSLRRGVAKVQSNTDEMVKALVDLATAVKARRQCLRTATYTASYLNNKAGCYVNSVATYYGGTFTGSFSAMEDCGEPSPCATLVSRAKATAMAQCAVYCLGTTKLNCAIPGHPNDRYSSWAADYGCASACVAPQPGTERWTCL